MKSHLRMIPLVALVQEFRRLGRDLCAAMLEHAGLEADHDLVRFVDDGEGAIDSGDHDAVLAGALHSRTTELVERLTAERFARDGGVGRLLAFHRHDPMGLEVAVVIESDGDAEWDEEDEIPLFVLAEKGH